MKTTLLSLQRRDARVIGALCLLLIGCKAWSAEFYVSPQGNDRAVGTKEQPFKTITHARDMARKVKDPVTVFLRGGIYPLRQTVVFNVQGSNTRYV